MTKMRTTGIKDLNGREIKEGDVIEYGSLPIPPEKQLTNITEKGFEAELVKSRSLVRFKNGEFVIGRTDSPIDFLVDDGVLDGVVVND